MKIRKTGYYSILGFLMIALAGCGYTKEEKEAMKRYEKQGRENGKLHRREVRDPCRDRKVTARNMVRSIRIFSFSREMCS